MARILKTMSDWMEVGTEIKIEELRNYLDTQGKLLENMATDFEKRVEAEAQKIDDEQTRQEYYEWQSEDFWRYKETFPRILMNSFHITAYSLLEAEINGIARRIGKNYKQVFDVTEIRAGDYLESANLYIKKLSGVDCKKFKSWNQLKEGQRLRNILVHANGRISDNTGDIDLAKKYKLYDTEIEPIVKPIEIISITDDYCKLFLNTLTDFFKELYTEMKSGDFL